MPVLVVANKVDLMDKRNVSEAQGRTFAAASRSRYIETSAMTGANVDDAFQLLMRLAVRGASQADSKAGAAAGSVDIEDAPSKPPPCCA